ncbi:hypothetical protein [Herbiconiux flava]|uniref:Uncharacterized protein n=1 Tax=Herbiconiux flava TaxID=881268 RepID=A0A852SM61_9MICO|nr:hypothetical protein [Herbiconiux flava]NYD69097.1 hypothetical protein [Herbiconiux flava]
MTSEISRRTALGVSAWAVPVIALAVATPAQAASADAVAFAPSVVIAASRDQRLAVSGSAPGADRVLFTYPAGFGGPASAQVDAQGGFTLSGVHCPVGSATGSIIASADGLRSGSFTVQVRTGEQDTGSITWTTDAVTAARVGSGWALPPQPGSISSRGSFLPDVRLSYPAGYSGPDSVSVEWTRGSGTAASIGTFVVPGITIDAGSAAGTVKATPDDEQFIVIYNPFSATLAVTPA